MSILKKIVIAVANLGLGVMLFFLATMVVLTLTIANINYIKSTLKSSGFYDKFVPNTLQLIRSQSNGGGTQDENIQELAPIIEKVATPAIVQSFSEQALDGVDKWLSGDIKLESISINVKDLKEQITNQVASYLQNQMASLPVCSAIPSSIDVFNATCKPPTDFSTTQYNQMASDYISSLPFLKDDTLILGSQAKQNIKEAVPLATTAPKVYKALIWSPYVFAFFGVVFMVLLYVLNQDKYKAWRLIGHAFLTTGLMLFISGILSVLLISKGIKNAPVVANAEQISFTNNVIVPVAKKVFNSVGWISLYFGVGYGVVAAACYYISHRLKILANKTHLKEEVAEATPDKVPENTAPVEKTTTPEADKPPQSVL